LTFVTTRLQLRSLLATAALNLLVPLAKLDVWRITTARESINAYTVTATILLSRDAKPLVDFQMPMSATILSAIFSSRSLVEKPRMQSAILELEIHAQPARVIAIQMQTAPAALSAS